MEPADSLTFLQQQQKKADIRDDHITFGNNSLARMASRVGAEISLNDAGITHTLKSGTATITHPITNLTVKWTLRTHKVFINGMWLKKPTQLAVLEKWFKSEYGSIHYFGI